MRLIVGLGNPGIKYANSRHNIGFAVVKRLSRIYKIPLKRDNLALSLSGKGKIENQVVLLALPLTFMNLSGIAVSALLKKYKIDLADLLVICDDLDLELGRLKIRPSGSSGGHRGLRSIIEALKTQELCRLRIGIGSPLRNIEPSVYVLSPFKRQQRQAVEEAINNALDCCQVWVSEGINKSMNIFNQRSN